MHGHLNVKLLAKFFQRLIIWIQNTAYCQKNGIQPENAAETNFNILFAWVPPAPWGLGALIYATGFRPLYLFSR